MRANGSERATRTERAAKRRARERVGEPEGQSPSDKNDMVKAIDKAMVIGAIRLVKKTK